MAKPNRKNRKRSERAIKLLKGDEKKGADKKVIKRMIDRHKRGMSGR